MKKLKVKRITAFLMALTMTVSTVLTAFAADGWTPAKAMQTEDQKGYIEFTFGSGVDSQLYNTYGAVTTGLSMERTLTNEAVGDEEFYYEKYWTRNRSASTKDVKLRNGDLITVNFSSLANTYLSCLADHTGAGNLGLNMWGGQLAVYESYMPSNDSNLAYYPNFIQANYSGENAKFALLLLMTAHTLHDPSSSEVTDTIDGTVYSIIGFEVARCLETGVIKGLGASPDADWAAVWASDYMQELKKSYNPDKTGSSQIWTSLQSEGAEYFKECWKYADFLSHFDYTVQDKKILVTIPTTETSDNNMPSLVCDYSGFSEYAKEKFRLITATGSSGITVTNSGDKLVVTSSSPISDESLASGITINFGGSPKNIAPAFLLGTKVVGRNVGDVPDLGGQTRLLAGTAEFKPVFKIGGGGTPSHGGETGSSYPDLDRYHYQDNFTADYNIRVKKYDSETGQPLADSVFEIEETLNEDSIDGCLTDGSNYDENEITDDCDQGPHVTNNDGVLTYTANKQVAHKDTRTYSYHKGYCQGHPAKEDYYPEEPDGDDEEAMAEYEAACDAVDEKYEAELAICRDTLGGDESGSHGFFCFGEADVDGSMAKAAFEADRDKCYEAFIAITYDYTVHEKTARKGYVLHGNHTDDAPIETDTVYSSQYLSGGGSMMAMAAPSSLDRASLKMLADAKIKDAAADVMSIGTITAFAAEQEEAPLDSEPVVIVEEVCENDGTSALEEAAAEVAPEAAAEEVINDVSSAEEAAAEITDAAALGNEEENTKGTKEDSAPVIIEEPSDEVLPDGIILEDDLITEEDADLLGSPLFDDGCETPYDRDIEKIRRLLDEGEMSVASPSDATPSNASQSDADGYESMDAEELSLLEAVLIELREIWLTFWGGVEDIVESGIDTLSDEIDGVGDFFAAAPKKMKKMLLGMSVPSGSSGSYFSAYSAWMQSDIPVKDKGERDIVDHTFIVFDHRTEGEVHFNKRDLNLSDKENKSAAAYGAEGFYDSYGDANGDGTLEGAVYGLFAAEDIVHPDGHTGVVYTKDSLLAVATTDKNGDGSFSVFTEAPNKDWSYTEGKVVDKTENLAPTTTNMHRSASKPEAQLGTKDYEGTQSPAAVGASTAVSYRKLSSNQTKSYPIANNEDNNGNCWIGRPLITLPEGTHYYIKELSRSEGYELSVTGKSNELSNGLGNENETPITQSVDVSKTSLSYGATIPAAAVVTVTGTNVTSDVTIKVTGAAAGAASALSVTETQSDPTVIEAIPYTEMVYYYPDAGTQVIINGDRVEASVGQSFSLASGTYTVTQVSPPEPQNKTVAFKTPYLKAIPSAFTGYTTMASFVAAYNTALAADPYKFGVPDANAPWIRVPLTGGSSAAWSTCIVNAIKDNGLWYANRMRVELDGTTAVIKYDNFDTILNKISDGFEDLTNGKLYVKYDTNMGYFVYLPFDKDDTSSVISYTTGGGHVVSANIKGYTVNATGTYPAAMNAVKHDIPDKTYWVYDGTMKRFKSDTNGVIDSNLETRSISPTDPEWGDPAYKDASYRGWKYISGTKTVENVTALTTQFDTEKGVYYITIPASSFLSAGTKAVTLKLYDNGAHTYSPSVTQLFSYVPASGGADSYRVSFTLQDTFDGTESPVTYSTAAITVTESGKTTSVNRDTVKTPLSVSERAIRQRIIVGKDIWLNADENMDGTGDAYRNNTYDYAEVAKETNFRFKTYLKSNLERLYRDANGLVTWTDENGNVISPLYYDADLNAVGDTEAKERAYVKWLYVTGKSGKLIYPYAAIYEGSLGANKGTVDRLTALNVGKIYTKTAHETASKTIGSRANNVFNAYENPNAGATADAAQLAPFSTAQRAANGEAVKTNASLYSYQGKNTNSASSDKIRTAANTGFTRILETKDVKIENGAGAMTTVQQYDYDKFFAAIKVANNDKWDDNNPTYTSWRPVGNQVNRTAAQTFNSGRSDMVRQFAIDYYLEDEVAKLVKTITASGSTQDEAIRAISENNYSNEVYDEALMNAIKKAEDYLIPFFKYDLDCIYSINWDSAEKGGNDKDFTTLSADFDTVSKTYNTSAYLPYGVYIVVEQQPTYVGADAAAFNDFANKHYEIDRPKEVKVPSLYAGGKANATANNYLSAYTYTADMITDISRTAMKDYLIRFGEENALTADHVIRAHSFNGDFEVYPYGLDVDYLAGNGKSITSTSGAYSYVGFSITQEQYDPLKDYYPLGHYGNSNDGSSWTFMPPYLSGLNGRIEMEAKDGANNNSKWAIETMPLNASETTTANGSAYDPSVRKTKTAYGAISEDSGNGSILTTGSAADINNPSGITLRTGVRTMTGQLTAYEGEYAQMLVPYTLTDPADIDSYNNAAFRGYADVNERNTFYSAKLRIEKLDSETHEPVLHDGAAFAIYKAERDSATGEVLFYTADTAITGSKEFVTAYCKKETVMPVDPEDPRGLYKGTVAAGTPKCSEADLVILGDRFGNQVSEFKAYSTTVDVAAKTEAEDGLPLTYMYQNTGYLETPQPLGAGAYVIVEKKVPSGYVRTAPVGIEVYSDRVTYYKEGNKDERIAAAIYEKEVTNDDATENRNKPQDKNDVAQIYIEDVPIKLTVEKVKESSVGTADTTPDKSVTYRVSGRVDGSLTDLKKRDDLELAYIDTQYQGYGYYKGTLEYLALLKDKYDALGGVWGVDIVYIDGIFAGYGYVTRPLETSDDISPYVAGAKLTLFEAIRLRRNESYNFGKSDYAFSFPDMSGNDHALIVERDLNHNVTRMYVEEGYAGIKTTYLPERDASGNPITTDFATGYTFDGKPIVTNGYVWDVATIERHDTDILHYDLDSLDVTVDVNVDGVMKHYGYDKDHNRVVIDDIEHDKASYQKTDNEFSIYAFKGGVPYLEFVGGDFSHITYSSVNKTLSVDADTIVYHIDEDGNRDAMVDPYTGMAYLIEEVPDGAGGTMQQFMVWPVEVYRDAYGNIIASDKITTSRIGTIGENIDAKKDGPTVVTVVNNSFSTIPASKEPYYEHTESGYISGSWKSDAGEESHQETSDRTTLTGKNLNGENLLNDNNGSFGKELSPVYDKYGNIIYYQRSTETYEKGTNLYDRDDDFVRYDVDDNLEEYNDAAYRINNHEELYDANENVEDPATKKLYHRYGEGYVLENTWVTGDYFPNDPFNYLLTEGQPDIIKRIPAGDYILEESFVPNGDSTNGAYVKALPVALTINEDAAMHNAKVVEKTTKLEIAKLDSADSYTVKVYNELGEFVEEYANSKTDYTYRFVDDAVLALFPAKKVYTSDYTHFPKGYYLEKTSSSPVTYTGTEWSTLTANWTVSGDTIYVEGLPKGFYILEEVSTPEGYITAAPVEVEIGNDLDVNEVVVNNDHSKLEIEKFYLDDSDQKVLLKGATMELHKAVTDGSGNVVFEDGKPKYESTALFTWQTSDGKEWAGFESAFADMFASHGTDGTMVGWTDGSGFGHTATYVSHTQLDQTLSGGSPTAFPTTAFLTYKDDFGRIIKIAAYEKKTASGKTAYEFDIAYDTTGTDYITSYTTLGGQRRFNRLPIGGKYVVVETAAPTGFAKAAPKVVTVGETSSVTRFMIQDEKTHVLISKVLSGYAGEAEGIDLALYRAEGTALVKDTAHLVDTWTTGEDGVYTSEDLLYGRIPEGYKKGDLRPHKITDIPFGNYYVVELDTLSYYGQIEPLMFNFADSDIIKLVRVTNKPINGQLIIKKTDNEDAPLNGATYLVKRYRKSDYVNPVWQSTYTAAGDTLTVNDLPVGEFDEKGNITPYRYTVREILPPEGFASSSLIYSFQFNPDKSGTPYAEGETAVYACTYKDCPTEVTISKKELLSLAEDTSEEAYILGAELTLYILAGVDANGNPIYDETSPVESYTVTASELTHTFKGIHGGKSYVLIETVTPTGRTTMKPVMFTLSEDGRKSTSLTNRLEALSFNTITATDYALDTENLDTDSIMSVTMHGRYIVSVRDTVYDKNGTEMESWPAGLPHEISIANGYTDGGSYTVREETTFSDGTAMITDEEARTFFFDENGKLVITSRTAEKVNLGVYQENGDLIDSFDATSALFEKVVENGLSPENPLLTISQQGHTKGEALDPSLAVINSLRIINPSYKKSDVKVTVWADDDTAYLDPSGGSVSGNYLTYEFTDVEGHGVIDLSFITGVSGKATTIKVKAEAGTYTKETEKTVPVLMPKTLIIYNELTGSGKELYKNEESEFTVRLYNNNTGIELGGTYYYEGSVSGSLKSGDTVSLKGNQYIRISTGVYTNVKYEVTRFNDGRAVTGSNTTGVFTDTEGAAATFTRSLPDTSDRAVFKAGGLYDVNEITTYSDGTEIVTNRLQVRLNESGGVDNITAFDATTKVAIQKLDYADGSVIRGTKLSLYDKTDALLEEWESEDAPHIIKGKLTEGETYRIHEVKPTDGWGINSTDVYFTVNRDGLITQRVNVYDKKTLVAVNKTDFTTGELLAGCILQIFDMDDNLIAEWTSTTEEKVFEGLLIAGKKYKLVEKRPVDGYGYHVEAVEFTVPMEGGEKITVVMDDKETEAHISKVDMGLGAEIAGCAIQIIDAGGTVIEEWVSTDTPHIIKGKLIADAEYTIREIRPVDGYGFAEEDVKFTVNHEGGIITYATMEDKMTEVHISKVDITGGNEIEGCTLEVLDEEGNLIETWVSTDTPHIIKGKLIADKTYILRETHPADGYGYYVEDIKFTVNHVGGVVSTVTMKDDITKVSISKVDTTDGKELAGCTLELRDEDGTLIETWVSTNEPHMINGKLIADKKYILYETGTVDGYSYASSITFTVNHEGGVETKVKMVNEPTHVEVEKTDENSGKLLAGAIFQIIDKATGNVVEYTDSEGNVQKLEWTTENAVKKLDRILVAGKTYILHEVKAPSGYKISNADTEFTVPLNNETYTVTVKNAKISGGGGGGGGGDDPYKLTLKKKTVDDKWLAGAELTLYRIVGDKETKVQTSITNESGIATFNLGYNNVAGEYFFVEDGAPSGFSRDKYRHYITVDAHGNITEGVDTLVDDFARVSISKVDFYTYEALPAAEFTLYDLSGNAIDHAVSDETGYAEFTRVPYGEFYILETGAPLGHTLSPEKRFVSISKFYTNAAPIVWVDLPDYGRLRPRTDDSAPILPLVLLALLFGTGFAVAAIYQKKKKKED